MSSSVQDASNSYTYSGAFNTLKPHLINGVSGGVAIIPVFRLFQLKTSLQQNQPMPPNSLIKRLLAARNIGLIIGSQLFIDEELKEGFKKVSPSVDTSSLKIEVVSTVVTSTLTSPLYLSFNRQTMGQSSSKISAKQVGAVVSRETTFLGGLKCSLILAEKMETKFGGSQSVGYITSFASGVLGSLSGHWADTCLTRMQGDLDIIPRKLMAGATPRSLGTGAFCMFYKFIKDGLNYFTNSERI